MVKSERGRRGRVKDEEGSEFAIVAAKWEGKRGVYRKLMFSVRNRPPKSLIGSSFRLSIPGLIGMM